MSQSVAELEEVEAFAGKRKWTPELRGLLTEIATTGVVRYDWSSMVPLLCSQLETTLQETEPELRDDARRNAWFVRLGAGIRSFSAPPFTTQRLVELLLEPGKQYRKLEKLASALEKLLAVTASIAACKDPPPPPPLVSLPVVNGNPPDVQFRHVASSEAFRGFLEERTIVHANGATNLTSHVLTTEPQSTNPPVSGVMR